MTVPAKDRGTTMSIFTTAAIKQAVREEAARAGKTISQFLHERLELRYGGKAAKPKDADGAD